MRELGGAELGLDPHARPRRGPRSRGSGEVIAIRPVRRSLTGWLAPRWPNGSLKVSSPAARESSWWPRQMPNTGLVREQLADRLDDVVERRRVARARARGRSRRGRGRAARRAGVVHGYSSSTAPRLVKLRMIERLMPVSSAMMRGPSPSPWVSGSRHRHLAGEVAADHARLGVHALHRLAPAACAAEKIPPRIAPASRMWRTSARVSTPLMPGTPLLAQPVQPALLGARGVGRVDRVAHDRGGGVDAAGLHRRLADAVVADVRRGEGDQLAREARVGHRLLVARHAGREDDLAGHLALGADGVAVQARAVLEQQVRRGAHLITCWTALNSGVPARSQSSNSAVSTLEVTAPGALHLAQADLEVSGVARADRVARDVHLDALPEQVVHGLGDADVRLDPAHDRLVAAAEVEAVGAHGREDRLLDRLLGVAGRPRARPARGPSGTGRWRSPARRGCARPRRAGRRRPTTASKVS